MKFVNLAIAIFVAAMLGLAVGQYENWSTENEVKAIFANSNIHTDVVVGERDDSLCEMPVTNSRKFKVKVNGYPAHGVACKSTRLGWIYWRMTAD